MSLKIYHCNSCDSLETLKRPKSEFSNEFYKTFSVIAMSYEPLVIKTKSSQFLSIKNIVALLFFKTVLKSFFKKLAKMVSVCSY